MEKFESIKNVKVSLHPSNPNPNPTYEDVDEGLIEKNVKTYIEEFDAGDGSLDIKDDEEVRKKLSMANDGYGRGQISGLDDEGEEKTVATDDQPTSEEVPIDDADSPNAVLEILSEKVQSIMARFKND